MAVTTDTKKSSGYVAGQLQRNSVPEGSYGVNLYHLTAPKWSADKADVNDSLTMEVTCSGLDNGAKAVFTIFERNSNCPDVEVVPPINAQVSGNKITAQWKFPLNRKLAAASSKWPVLPRFFFKCDCSGFSTRSGLLQLSGTISISLFDTDNKAVANEPAVIRTSYKQPIDAITDGSGKISLKKIPLGCHQIKFTKNPLIDLNVEQAVVSTHELPPFFPLSFFDQNKFYTNSFYLACSHEVKESKCKRTVKRPTVFEVVPSWEDKAVDKVSIFADRRQQVSDDKSNKLKAVDTEGGLVKSEFECAYSPGDGKANFFEKTFWRSFTKPNEYKINVGSKQVTLRAYCPDTYGIKISLPPLGKMSGGVKLTGKVADLMDKARNSSTHVPIQKNYEGKVEGWNPFHTFPIPMKKDVPIELSRNGKALALTPLSALGGVLKTIGEVEKIIEQIKEAVPKAGIYFDLEIAVMQGTLAASFCWKEYKDHRAFLSVAASIDLVLFSIGMEIGVGISGFSCALQIFGKIEGKLTISFKGERISPEGDKELKIPFGTSIEGSLGVRLQVVYVATATGAIKTAIEINQGTLKISSEEGVSISCGLKWTGIKGSLSVSVSAGKKGGEEEGKEDAQEEIEEKNPIKQDQEANKVTEGSWEKEWVKEKDLGTLQFPSSEEYAPPIIQREDVKRIIKEVFDKEGNVKILISFGRFYANWIEDLEEAINEHPKIRRTQRNVQALAYEIQKTLWNISNKYAGSKDRIIEKTLYDDFRESGKLNDILKRNGDSANDLAKDLSHTEKE
jgi:hypothetical protein